mgnify:CR=1 FL=1
MAAAVFAAENGVRTVVIEHNRQLGKKLAITGKGRCNVTNNSDNDNIMKNIPTGSRFLYSALAGFSAYDTMNFFEGLGVPLKTERGNRVFPVSDSAKDIVEALKKRMGTLGVKVITAHAKGVITEDGRVKGVRLGESEVYANSVIIATGGASYSGTGSDGSGYEIARALGHTIVEPKPMLVPICVKESCCCDMSGLSLKNVTLSLIDTAKNKPVYREQGEMLFTHFGLSGPLVLSASAHMRHFGSKKYRVEIDLKPALDEKTLDKRLLADFDKHKNSDFINALGELLPKKLIPVVIEKSGIDPREKVNSITKAQRAALLRVLKAFPVEISGKRPIAEAIITTGGVSVREVSPKTMESKKLPHLYFAGEVLDVDAYTGGFNLQIAWSTGRLAGLSAAEEES